MYLCVGDSKPFSHLYILPKQPSSHPHPPIYKSEEFFQRLKHLVSSSVHVFKHNMSLHSIMHVDAVCACTNIINALL